MRFRTDWHCERRPLELQPGGLCGRLRLAQLPSGVRIRRIDDVPSRVIRGTMPVSSSSRFPVKSGATSDIPVMFPPGRRKLATNPFPDARVPTLEIDEELDFVNL